MGLRDLLKRKKSTEVDEELVGGLTDTDWEASLQTGLGAEQESDDHQDNPESSSAWQGFSGSAGQAEEVVEEQEEDEKQQQEEEEEKAGSGLSGLDIFTSETAEDEDSNKLAAQLPEVDIQDLLRECREMVSLLREH